MPVASDEVFLGLGTVVPGCEQHGSEKKCRRRLAGREYRVLMQFGDQLGDFVEVADNTQAARAALLDEYGDWFGERRSEERGVGKECVSTCRSRWSPYY